MPRNDGKDFEKLVERIFTKLTENDPRSIVLSNQMIVGPEGARQFDVVLQSIVAGLEITTIIECKDYKAPVNVTAIDALQSKLVDAKANKGILASRNGFSTKARQKAKRVGITLCEVDDLANKLDNPLAFLPVVLWYLSPNSMTISFQLEDGQGVVPAGRLDANSIVSGLGMMDLVRLAVTSGTLEGQLYTLELSNSIIGKQMLLDLSTTHPKLKSLNLKFPLSGRIQFGYAKDLPKAVIKSQLDIGETTLFFEIEDLSKKSRTLFSMIASISFQKTLDYFILEPSEFPKKFEILVVSSSKEDEKTPDVGKRSHENDQVVDSRNPRQPRAHWTSLRTNARTGRSPIHLQRIQHSIIGGVGTRIASPITSAHRFHQRQKRNPALRAFAP